MLKVSFDKLASGSAKQMFPCQFRLRHRERHPILKLIAESVRAAGLVKCRARPHPAGQCLIQEPAVEQDVHRTIGCLHLHCPEGVAPKCCYSTEDRVEVDGSEARDQGLCFVFGRCFTKKDNDLCLLVGFEFNAGLHGTTGIKSGTNPIREWRSSRQERQDGRACHCVPEILSGLRSSSSGVRQDQRTRHDDGIPSSMDSARTSLPSLHRSRSRRTEQRRHATQRAPIPCMQ